MEPQICTCGPRHYYDDGRAVFIGYISILISMFIAAGLLVGLTLGLMTSDLTWLNIMAIAGNKKQKKQAAALVNIKQRSTWFLCK